MKTAGALGPGSVALAVGGSATEPRARTGRTEVHVTSASLTMGQDRQLLATDLLRLAMRRCAGGSFLHRFTSLARSNTDAFTGDRASYDRLLQRVRPADVIEWGDTPGQVLMLLSLDTERRDQLRLIAAHHGWPAPQPQPWDEYVALHSD